MPVKPLLIAFVMATAWSGAALASEACPDLLAAGEVVRLAGVNGAGDPVLADGRSLRLVGLAPRQDAAEAARFADGIARWRDQELHLVSAGKLDRWGRLPARLVVVPASARSEFEDL